MATKTTITTAGGHEATGKVVRRESYTPTGADLLGFAVTLGASAKTWPSGQTTVVDRHGNHWTGREKR